MWSGCSRDLLRLLAPQASAGIDRLENCASVPAANSASPSVAEVSPMPCASKTLFLIAWRATPNRSRSRRRWVWACLALLLLAFCVFVIVIYRLSVVISDLKDANIAMAQRLAIVEFQLNNRNED